MLGIPTMALRRIARLLALSSSCSSRVFAALGRAPAVGVAKVDNTSRQRNSLTSAPRRLVPGGVALVAALVATVFGSERDAHASGYLTARYGSDQGTPATPNPYAVYFNPAAMGGSKGTEVVIDVSLVLRQASYVREGAALSHGDNPNSLGDSSYQAANTGKGTLLNLLALPYLGVTSDLGTKSLRVGGAFYIPYGGMAVWDKKPETVGVPGSFNGPQRWHNISGTILAMHTTLAASYTIEPLNLSIGANVSGIFHTVSTVRARNVDDTDNTLDRTGRIAEGRSYLSAQAFNMTMSGGLYWATRDQKLKLGLSYTAPPGFGETRMRGDLTQQLGTSAVATESQKIDFLQSYPDIIRFGTAYRINQKWEVKGDFEYVRWGLFKRQCVVLSGAKCETNDDGSPVSDAASKDIVLNLKRDWKDAIGLRIGPSYFLSPDVELFGSVGFTTPAVPKATIDAGTIDSFRLYGALGARVDVSKRLTLAASYNHIFFLPVDNTGQSIYAKNKVPSRSPGADGRYNSQIGMLNVNATIKF